jgi:hypothetical protein
MGGLVDNDNRATGERLGSSGLMDRLNRVRKRKQAHSGQRVGAEAIRRLLREEQRRCRGG